MTVSSVAVPGSQAAQGGCRDKPFRIGDFLRATDQQPLPMLDRTDELRRLQQRVMGAGVEPGVAAAGRVKNWVRPLGLMALKLPCQLMGTGMAFPWDVVRSADLASGRIVEDLKLGLDLALSGSPPLFCPSAVVTSEFSVSVKGADAQRERWEYGHINLILTLAPRLLYLAILRGNLGLLALTLDMAVPPLHFSVCR